MWELGAREVGAVKAVVAGAGVALLLAGLALDRARRPGWARAWDASLVVLGVVAAACWWNLFRFNYPMFGHPSETFHYFVGAKYFPELGYTRLYACTALADAEAGLADEVAGRSVRNLATNTVEPAAPLLAAPDACKRHFSEARWRAFSRDVAWFRNRLPPRRWRAVQTDHGYNGTPAWGLFGSALAHTGPASDTRILALRLVDPLLLLLTGAAVAGVFGWRALCVALLYFGTNYPAQYGWVGGSYLRQLELAAVVGALCLMRRGRMLPAGFLLATAGLVRIYPLALLAGPALKVCWNAWESGRPTLSAAHRRLLVGGLAAAALWVPLGALTSGGLGAWPEFAENSRLLLGTPMRNHMGLRTALSQPPGASARELRDPSLEDPLLPWKSARQETFAARRVAFAGLLAGYTVLLAFAVRREPDWAATALAAGMVPMAAELTCYYMAILVVFAPLWTRHRAIGVALVALAAAGWPVAGRLLFFDEIFVWLSLATVVCVVFATSVPLWSTPREAAPLDSHSGARAATPD